MDAFKLERIMGMYTEIYVNVDFNENTPKEIIDVVRAICEMDRDNSALKDKPDRWVYLFNNGSYYTPNTKCRELSFDQISNQYSLIGKGDLKNYEDEIGDFFKFIKPYVEGGFMGYSRYEEDREPTLHFK